MDIIKHDSNGAKGIRIAASVCVVIGWIALFVAILVGIAGQEFPLWLCAGAGVLVLVIMYLQACFLRGFATIVEAAQQSRDIN